jgi:hypothetical protein
VGRQRVGAVVTRLVLLTSASETRLFCLARSFQKSAAARGSLSELVQGDILDRKRVVGFFKQVQPSR